ncbi:MAG: hypothetical protein BGO87_07000 [Flavobacteriia bacterium 40-80]|nr:MAG: hypothetical protein BGO87_07000 [Flavobacteriia bacterium 40-80]
MKKIQIIIFFLVIIISDSYSQITITEKGKISFRIVYGDNKPEPDDYKSTSGPVALFKGIVSPYKSLVIYSDWWTLMGQLVYNNGVKWELRDKFSFFHENKIYELDRSKLAKYPDLIKRLDVAGPTNKWNMTLYFNVKDNEQNEYKLSFFISDNDIVAAWRNGEISYRTPGSPNKFKDRISMSKIWRQGMSSGSGATLNEDEIKSVWSKLISLTYNDSETALYNNTLSIENPYEIWAEIANLYEKYEKEGYKTLSEEIENEKKDLKTYNTDDEWSLPFEDNSSNYTIEYSQELKLYVVKNGNKIIKQFPKEAYSSIKKIENTDKWLVRLETEQLNNYQIMTSKGQVLSFQGNDSFSHINEDENSIQLIVLTSDQLYNRDVPGFLEFGEHYPPFFESYSSAKDRLDGITWKGYKMLHSAFIYNAEQILLNKNFVIINKKTGAIIR